MTKNIKKIIASLITVYMFLISVSIHTNADFTNSIATNSNYNRNNAYNYIKKYVLTPNPAYVDFTDLGGDCTNFVSQVLRAGAMSFTATSPNPNYLYWYYYNSTWGSGRTSTWTSAHDFRQHWGEINNIGMKRAYKYTKYTVNDAIKNFGEIHSALWPGDVIQHVDSNGNTYHSQAVYIISANDIIVGQHTYNIIRSLKDYLLARQDAGYGTDWVCIIQIKKGP